MKIDISSKGATIRYESELALQFREFLPDDPDLKWRVAAEGADGRPQALELKLDGKRFRFSPVYELKPSLPWLENLKPTKGIPPLLVTPELSPRVVECCRRNGIAGDP